jgi:eukaryotic-like serine/threonine-protein kinase
MMSDRPSNNLDGLEINLARRLDEVCRRFEADWREGRQPRIEDYLVDISHEGRPALRAELAALERQLRRSDDTVARPEAGPPTAPEPQTAPNPSTIAEAPTIDPGPQPTTSIVGEASSLIHEEATVPPSNPPRSPHDQPTAAMLGQDPSTTLGASSPDRIRCFGDYEIIREIARGGMGVVFQARQVSLNRPVALKMILAGQLANETDVKRFYTEAEAAANLDHPGIVPVYEVGQHDAQHYFSMGFVEGQSLAQRLADGPLPPREAAALLVKVAEAIEYAHRRGVIHRDLKPGNILLDRNGNPRVTDFGLAKKLQGDSGLSGSGQIIGTPSYMPPEQAGGRRGEVGPAADVYALGAMLYALVTGRPPFQAATPMDTVLMVVSEEPVPPRRLNAAIPRDLETIDLKCLEKEPGKRYASAAALGDDLRRYLGGEPIVARPVTPLERGLKWARRRPAIAGLAAALMLATVLGVAGIVWEWRKAEANFARAETNLVEANLQRGIAKDKLFDSLKAQARAGRFSRRAGQRFDSLDALTQAARIGRERRMSPEQVAALRDEAIACMALPDLRPIGRVIQRPPGVLWTSFDPTMTRYALRFRQGTISVRRVIDDQETARFQARGDRDIWVFGFSPDGRYLATTHWPGAALTVWDIDLHEVCLDDPGPVASYAAKFSPDSRRVALGHADGELVVYDLATGRPSRRWPGPAAADDLVFRSDGAQIAVTSSEKNPTCRILEAESGRVVRSIPMPTGGTVAWSPDGALLASPGGDKIYLWDVATGIQKATLEGHTNSGLRAVFHPAGTLLASNGWENRLRLWDPVLGLPVLSLTGGSASEFSQDGRIVVAIEDKLTPHRVDPALEYRTFATVRKPINYARASIRHDSRVLAVGADRGVVLWDMDRGTELAFLPIGNAWHLMFEPSGDLITSGTIGVHRWPVQFDAGRGEFRIGHPRQLSLPAGLCAIDEDRSGRIVAKANHNYAFVAIPERTIHVGPLDDCRYIAISPDGQWLATGSHNRGAQVWRIHDATKVAELPIDGPTGGVSFSPDGKWLMTEAAPCRLWEVGEWREARQVGGQGRCFTPDGRCVVVAEPSRVIRLVEIESGRTEARLESPDLCALAWAACSPDGARLVVTTNDGPAVHVWDLRAIGRQLKEIGLAWDLPEDSDQGENLSHVPLRVEIATEGRTPGAPSLTIDASLKTVAPTLDGRIGPGEYGPGYDVRFDDEANPGILFAGTPARSKAPDDYSYRLHAAHTASALYLAFEVRDQDVRVNPEASQPPFNNDSVGLFIDGDHVPNDFRAFNSDGNREGFQIGADADGHQYTVASDLTNSDWKVATRRVDGGYTMEFEIPLSAIDTQDGPGTAPAKTGDILRFIVGGRDVDAVGGTNIGILWAENPAVSPFIGGEDVWTVALRLLP